MDKEKEEIKKKKVEILKTKADILSKRAELEKGQDKKKADLLKKKSDLLKQKAELEKHPVLGEKLTSRQRAADKISSVVGSWTFIIVLIIFVMSWGSVNIYMIVFRWDPYPFILLNLFLSVIAAIQAPIILMSQGRQVERDRINAKYDYQVNRKAEREIQDMQKDLDEIKSLIKSLRK